MSSACPSKVTTAQAKYNFHSIDHLASNREIQFDRLGVSTTVRPIACDVSRPGTSGHCQMNANRLGHALALSEQFHQRQATKCNATTR
jgi:hypothetical protein